MCIEDKNGKSAVEVSLLVGGHLLHQSNGLIGFVDQDNLFSHVGIYSRLKLCLRYEVNNSSIFFLFGIRTRSFIMRSAGSDLIFLNRL